MPATDKEDGYAYTVHVPPSSKVPVAACCQYRALRDGSESYVHTTFVFWVKTIHVVFAATDAAAHARTCV
jgi:hypothetical protein